MSVEVKVPALPESVADATLLNWHKQPGESVQRDENLVDLETDKVVLEIPAPTDGVLGRILQDSGATVTAGDVIAMIEEDTGTAAAASETAEAGAGSSSPDAEAASAPLSPAVRRLIAEHDLDPGKIPATGRSGRLTKADVVNFMQTEEASPPAAKPEPEAVSEVSESKPPQPSSPPPAKPSNAGEQRLEQRVPMTRLRTRIAERLVEAQQTAAMLTTFNEVNMQPVMKLRKTYREKFEKEHGVRLGFMSFFVKACIEALKRFPAVNGSIDGQDIIYHGYYDIGIAVSSPRGLVVPILRDVDQMSFADIENNIRDFGQRAEEGTLTMEDLTGGTFSITNGGVFGSMMSTPILNPPQSAILGMHSIMDRPMAVNGEVAVMPMMYLAVTYDHRIIDGREAVSFLVTIKDCLEDPARLLLQI